MPEMAGHPSRRDRNRLNRALHGSIKMVVGNIGGLSNLGLAVKGGPEVALLQELWAPAEAIKAEAKKFG